ncbi:UNVERIFIED_CONTAM: hypothetical protein Sradi_4956200 [Sesamum radiatum]|uniref:Uncharacterized protein n=1 Tax=Sesamum radiatum TaxID=300843 RepID=A0AAW2MGD9_SESRA
MIFLSLASLQSLNVESQVIKSARLLDLVIRDYTFRSYNKNFRTGKLHKINLPANLSGILVDTIRFRCGSLHRYGAKIKEFHLDIGTLSAHFAVLGLLAYNVGRTGNTTVPSELGIQAGKKPITIDFGSTTLLNTNSGIIPLCASFDQDGKVTLSNQARPRVCVATRDGHFGLVVESPLMPLRRKVSKWKIAIGSSIGAALGAFSSEFADDRNVG